MTMGMPIEPEPSGCSSPVNVEPALKHRLSPGMNVVAFTLASDFHAVAVERPSFESFPAAESTK